MKRWTALTIAPPTHRRRLERYGAPTLSIAATLGWMALILVILGSSDSPGPDLRAWWFPILAHLFLFGVLGFLVSVSGLLAVRSSRLPPNMALVVFVGGCWGVFTELYQYTVPGRSATAGDGLVDVAGSVLGGVMAWAVMLWISRNLAGTSHGPIHRPNLDQASLEESLAATGDTFGDPVITRCYNAANL